MAKLSPEIVERIVDAAREYVHRAKASAWFGHSPGARERLFADLEKDIREGAARYNVQVDEREKRARERRERGERKSRVVPPVVHAWRAFAKWPGMAPLLMGKVWGTTEEQALYQARNIWPQVPDWGIRW